MPRRLAPALRLAPLVAALSLALGCDSLSEFKGNFEGQVVEGSFVRSCFEAGTTAELRFNPSLAVGDVSAIPVNERNWLKLFRENDEQKELIFDAELDPINAISSDTLSDFDFPGQKRVRNFMLMARTEIGPLAGRDTLVVVSLLATKNLELRVIARGENGAPTCDGAEDAGDEAPEYYGLFKLK